MIEYCVFKNFHENNDLSSMIFFLQKIPFRNCFWAELFHITEIRDDSGISVKLYLTSFSSFFLTI